MNDVHPQPLFIVPERAIFGRQIPTSRRFRRLTSPGDALRQRFVAAVTRDPPEAPAWADFGIAAEDFDARLREIRLFYRMYASRAGKPRWGDETPGYGRRLKAIERLLPEARSSHLVRDGRDAAVSLRGLYAFVDLDFHEAMLRQHEASRGSPRRAPRSE